MPTNLTVTGMTCDHCEQHVVEALQGVDGVEAATADRDAEAAVVEGDAHVDDLIEAVESAGYSADE